MRRSQPVDGGIVGGGVTSAKLLDWRDLGVYKALQGNQTGLGHRMKRTVAEMRREEQGPDPGRPGGPHKEPGG